MTSSSGTPAARHSSSSCCSGPNNSAKNGRGIGRNSILHPLQVRQQPGAPLGAPLGVRRVGDQVVLLMRIGVVVVQMRLAITLGGWRLSRPVAGLGVVHAVGPAIGADPTPDTALGDLVERLGRPVIDTGEQILQRPAVERVRHRHPGHTQDAGGQIDQAHRRPGHVATGETRAVDHQGHAQRGVMATPLVFRIAGAEVAAVVGGEDDDRVLGLTARDELVSNPGQGAIERVAATEIIGILLAPITVEVAQVAGRLEIAPALARTVRTLVAFVVVLVVWLDVGTDQKPRAVARRRIEELA